MKKSMKFLLALSLCLVIICMSVIASSAATYDTNSSSYYTSSSSYSSYTAYYFEDYTYNGVVRKVALYDFGTKIATIANITTSGSPQYTQFQVEWGQNVKYKTFLFTHTYEQPSVTRTVSVSANSMWHSAQSDMEVVYASNWTVKSIQGWYNCQPTSNLDNHYCIINQSY